MDDVNPLCKVKENGFGWFCQMVIFGEKPPSTKLSHAEFGASSIDPAGRSTPTHIIVLPCMCYT